MLCSAGSSVLLWLREGGLKRGAVFGYSLLLLLLLLLLKGVLIF